MKQIFIPRKGAVFISNTEWSQPLPIGAFGQGDITNAPDGWEWLGSLTTNSPFELEKVDPDSANPDEFDGEHVTLCDKPDFWKFTIPAVWGSRKNVAIAFGGEKYDATVGGWVVDKIRPTYKSVVVLLQETPEENHGFYMGRVKMLSDGKYSVDDQEFSSFSIQGFVLKPPADTWGKLVVFEGADQ